MSTIILLLSGLINGTIMVKVDGGIINIILFENSPRPITIGMARIGKII
jgi:hypothetical protein